MRPGKSMVAGAILAQNHGPSSKEDQTMRMFPVAMGWILLAVAGLAGAEPAAEPVPVGWSLYGQVTNVTQGHGPFTSPYEGDNSLISHGRTEETTDLTIY